MYKHNAGLSAIINCKYNSVQVESKVFQNPATTYTIYRYAAC